MSKRLTGWLSTRGDLQRVAADLDGGTDLRFVWAQYRETPIMEVYRSIMDSPHLGQYGAYFVIDPQTKVYQLDRPLHVKRGEWATHWYLDAERMPDSVCMDLPRTNSENKWLIAGELIAQTSSPLARSVFKSIVDAIKKTHVKRGNGLIGEEAWELAQQGWRPCFNPSQPPEYNIWLGGPKSF